MTEYVVKLRFWLRCWDSMHIEADSDEDAIRLAAVVAQEMMQSANFPESIEADERRGGLVSYIDRVDAEGRNEIAEAIEFPGARPLFPEADKLVARLAGLRAEELNGEDRMRGLLAEFANQARQIRRDVPPLTSPTD